MSLIKCPECNVINLILVSIVVIINKWLKIKDVLNRYEMTVEI